MVGVVGWVFGRTVLALAQAQAMGCLDGGRFVGFKEPGSQAVLGVGERVLNTDDVDVVAIMGYGEWMQCSLGVGW